MRRALLFCAVAALAAQGAFGIAASQAWVESYVSNYVAKSAAEVQANTTTSTADGGVTVIEVPDGGTVTVEPASDAALKVQSATAAAVAAGVSDGTLFVWNGAGAYVNPVGEVTCTATNMVYGGVGSTYSDGLLHFAGWFDARAVRIQPSVSLSVTNGTEGVSR